MKGQTIRQIRTIHNYVGMLFAPAILFFSISGAFQTLGMHEDRGHGQPMAWVAWMASVHKDQVVPHAKAKVADHQPGPVAEPGKRVSRPAPHSDQPFTLLKAFVLCMALGLISSASLGIIIAFTNPRTRRANLACLAAGAALPLLFLFTQ